MDSLYSDSNGTFTVEYLKCDFQVGRDNAFIRLHTALWKSKTSALPNVNAVTLDLISDLNLLSLTHVVDCRAEDAMNFKFVIYGRATHLENGRDFQARRVGDATWTALRNMGAVEYARIKHWSRPDFSRVRYDYDGKKSGYLRLILPLSESDRQTTHLMICSIPDPSLDVVGGTRN